MAFLRLMTARNSSSRSLTFGEAEVLLVENALGGGRDPVLSSVAFSHGNARIQSR